MESTAFDAIVIGAGQAGPSLAVEFAQRGMRTALIERERLGGTCVNVGCIPTKTLVASARAAQVARRAAEWGVRLSGGVQVDMAAVKARKDGVVDHSRGNLERWIAGTDRLTLIRGAARFVDAHAVEVGGRRLSAPRIFLDVGAEAARPPIEGIDGVPTLDNRSILELDTLPDHLVVIGGSYIGLEFAQMYRRFGAQVTVVEMAPRLIAREDDEVSAAVQQILETEGVAVRTASQCLAVAARDGRIAVQTSCGLPEVLGTHLLLATGRKPNTADLGLDRAGIATDARGYIKVNDRLETSADGVWALGDCNGRGAFTHTAYNDYEIVAGNLLRDENRTLSERVPTYALFIDPPLGRAGLTEREVRQSGRPALIGRMPMTRVGRAREAGETQGFMKVLVDAHTEQILGAALLGMNADEVIHTLLDAMAARQPYTTLRRTMHIHPTVSELIPTLLSGLVPLR
ncbi:MAG TPA: FAD-containing oxidoreductase [Burkholderiaceae bacterium]|nr:FAD-containing oxidoreductase [Burkholderiaceae bacterium]